MGRKLAIGLVIVVLVAVGGYFGVRYYAERTAMAAVETAFDQIRARGVDARFGAAVVDPDKKAITLSGVEIRSKDAGVSVKVAQLTATGAEPPNDGYVEADTLDLDGVALTLTSAGRTISYTIPKVMIDRYRGPVAPVAPPEGTSAGDAYGPLSFALRQLAATSAAKVTIPNMSGRLEPAAGEGAPVEVAYEGIAAEQVSAGKVRSLLVDSIRFSVPEAPGDGAGPGATQAPATAGRVEGQLRGIVAARIDTGPILAAVSGGPSQRGQEGYQEIYGKVVTGPYRVAYPDGEISSAQSLLMEHVGIKPEAFTRERMEALAGLSHKGPDLSLEEARDFIARTTDVLDAVAFGTLAMTGVRGEAEGETVDVSSIRLTGFAAGVLDSFEMDGLEGRDAGKHPVKMGRIAVHHLDLPAVVRLSQDADDAGLPSLFELFKVISGVEVSDVVVPFVKEDGVIEDGAIKLGRLSFSWGSFLGALPSTLRFEMSDVSGPISAGDGEPFTYLANGGMTRATIGATLNIAYEAKGETLSINPLNVTVKDAFSVELEGGVGNLPKEAFSDAGSAFAALARFNAQPVRLKIRNFGLAELMIGQLAEAAGTTPEIFKQDLVSSLDEETTHWAQLTPNAPAVAAAIKAFIMDPKALTFTATPRTNAPLLPLLSSDDPFAMLAAYDISATAEP